MDSVVTCNKEEELFPNCGDYAVFSLAKMIHVPFGSIVVCRTDEAYERLKHTPMRSMSTAKWSDAINEPAFMDSVLAHNATVISDALTPETLQPMFEQAIQTIRQNVKAISELIGVDYTNPDRLPSNVFSTNAFPEALYERYNIEVRGRHVYDYQKCECLSVHLFPVHVDIQITDN